MKLSRDAIVDEAIALLQEEGLEAVSLRNVAARLDAKAPSLARHVGDKQSLLALMSSRLFLEALDDVAPGGLWTDWMVRFGRALWRKQRATRDAALLIAAAPPHMASMELVADRLRAQVQSVGLPTGRGMMIQSAVQALITGWTGFATGPQGSDIARLVEIEDAVDASLTALIHGFAA
jgi:TetR/AcrR family tetracycline transcriptional repressor